MVDYKTLRVPEPAWERAKDQKEAADRTWGEQIVRPDDDADTDAGDVAAAIQSLESSMSAVEERTGRIERTLEQLEGGMR
jgi:hypothetical protein